MILSKCRVWMNLRLVVSLLHLIYFLYFYSFLNCKIFFSNMPVFVFFWVFYLWSWWVFRLCNCLIYVFYLIKCIEHLLILLHNFLDLLFKLCNWVNDLKSVNFCLEMINLLIEQFKSAVDFITRFVLEFIFVQAK